MEITVKIKILKYVVFNLIMTLTNLVFWLCINHPQGNLTIFLKNLELVLQKLFLIKFTFIICGDININYLVDSYKKKQLDSILYSFNLCSIVNFPTRIGPSSLSTIDNVFIDNLYLNKYDIAPLINGLSDHDAQLMTIQISQKQLQPTCIL